MAALTWGEVFATVAAGTCAAVGSQLVKTIRARNFLPPPTPPPVHTIRVTEPVRFEIAPMVIIAGTSTPPTTSQLDAIQMACKALMDAAEERVTAATAAPEAETTTV